MALLCGDRPISPGPKPLLPLASRVSCPVKILQRAPVADHSDDLSVNFVRFGVPFDRVRCSLCRHDTSTVQVFRSRFDGVPGGDALV